MRQLYSTQLAIAIGILILAVTLLFAFFQSPELMEMDERSAMKTAYDIPHPIQGMQHCNSCHGLKGEKPYTLKHAGWNNESCTKCHSPASNPVN
jgi:cytochrome c553